MRIYRYFKNTGDWSGSRFEYFLANSIEEAKEYPKFLEDKEIYRSHRWDIDETPCEVDGKDILNALKIFDFNSIIDLDKINLEYVINEK